MEKPIYPTTTMRITQGYGIGSHRNSFAIDEAGANTGIESLRAPFTGIIKKIYSADANEVWLESVEKVEYPDGTIDYMTILFAHDNDVSNLYVGKKIKRGEIFYQEGTKGQVTGAHCHIECARGKFTGSGWYKNAAGYWSIINGKAPEDCLFIDDSIKIINRNGYNFKKIETLKPTVVTKPVVKEEKKEEIKDNKKLIFTCLKKGIYAIELNKGDKLYLE